MPVVEYIYGYHAVHAFLLQHAADANTLFLQKSSNNTPRMQLLQELAKQGDLPVQMQGRDQLSGLLPANACHQGVVLAVKNIPLYDEADLEQIVAAVTEPLLILILDGVQDPHNLGACLRSANAQGVHAVVIPKHNAVAMTAVVRKVACGAAEATPLVQVSNLARTLEMLKDQGVWLVGLDAEESQPLAELDLRVNSAIIMGSEGSGMRRLTKQKCDFLANIPMFGSVSSMNVSAATAITLYEARRQRS
jgi:23S rRNA (guanosine2251-2'-O)-methyltransferase